MKPFRADLHLHSFLSRATSKNANLLHLNRWAQLKGIHLVGTGDFTHPQWLAELQAMLEPAEPGLFRYKFAANYPPALEIYPACKAEVRFILSAEISNIYKRNDRVRKVHNVVFMPGFEAAQKFQSTLARIGNLNSDGRPILGLDSRDLLEITRETDPEAYLIPAHIWTPWFSVLGSNSGFDSIDECYADLSAEIFALETGLSSDPAMNWRLSQLDRFALVSNSDAHSPEKLAREANIFQTELSYPALFAALKSKNPEQFLGTIEFFPEEGKYHLDGHRACQARLAPQETQAFKNCCPVCGKKVTVGVLHRVEQLADREVGARPATAAPFRSLIPLPEIMAEVQGVGENSKAVQTQFHRLLGKLGAEIDILTEIPLEEIGRVSNSLLVEAIRRVRAGAVHIAPGYDGEYGTIRIFTPEEREKFSAEVFPGVAISAEKKKKKTVAPLPLLVQEAAAAPYGVLPKKSATAAPKPVSPLLQQLNASQIEAAQYTATPLLVIAGPGTGKTRTLTHRIAYLVQTQQVAPENILAITFTRHAAQEMQVRLEALSGQATTARMTIGTFHALGTLILKNDLTRLGRSADFSIYTPADSEAVLNSLPFDFTHRQVQQLRERISTAKSKLLTNAMLSAQAELAFPDEFLAVYIHYEQELRRQHALDYDDLILLPYLLLKDFPEVKAKYQRQFQWISVDEYQDINYAQYQFLRQLLTPHTNLCAIGDPDQAIYGFRGSDVTFFNRFQQDFRAAKIIRLAQNYRSTDLILHAATQVITKNPQPHRTEVWSAIVGQQQVEIVSTATEKAEAELVVHQIERLTGGTGFFSLDSGRVRDGENTSAVHSFNDFVVLYRLHSQHLALEEALTRSGMPYQTMGANPFFEHAVIKDLLAYLSALLNPASDVAFARILNVPPRGLGDRTLEILREFCQANNLTLFEGIENQALVPQLSLQAHAALDQFFGLWRELQFEVAKNTVTGIIQLLLEEVGLAKFYGETATHVELWNSLLNLARPYENRVSQFLNELLLRHETDHYEARAERITLMTLHAAKGLEFPIVFIVGCEENLIPFLKNAASAAELEQALAEERRLLYVGMTRAQQRLYLLHSHKRLIFGHLQVTQPSHFLDDIEHALKHAQARTAGHAAARPAENQLRLF
ncbi:UvrD-helicase domain-containing protein [candidate division KSB1 bacterium]|nr:UvrD-helicase domain-containing protein [candidate division KSB1 bacterium]